MLLTTRLSCQTSGYTGTGLLCTGTAVSNYYLLSVLSSWPIVDNIFRNVRALV